MPRPAVPTLGLVAIVLVAGCAQAEVPQGFAMEQGEFIYDMWLDQEGLPRILGLTIDALPIRVRYDDWDEDQGIAPPDPASVVTAPAGTPTTVPSATPGG